MKRTVILHLCILLSLLLVVRCDDDDDEEDVGDNNYANYGDYEPPTKEYVTDPKIISRNVKCLGKSMRSLLSLVIPKYNFSSSIQCAKQRYSK